MKQKVKGFVLKSLVEGAIAPKKKLPKLKPNVPTQLSEDTDAKQRKKDKLAQLKLKKSDKIKQLLLQKKKEKKAGPTADAPLASAEQQSSTKEHMLTVSSKIPPKQINYQFKPQERKANFVADPVNGRSDNYEPVQDPLVRAEISHFLKQRSASTVRVRGLPNRLRLHQIAQLCNGIKAFRVPWNYLANRHKGVAFLEFASPEAAKKAAKEISTSKALGCRLNATIFGVTIGSQEGDADFNDGVDKERADHRDDKDAEMGNVDAYDCRRVIVCGLHPHTTGQELKDLVNASLTDAAVLKVEFPHGCKQLNKSAPAVAYLTFADERRALEAVKKFQGHLIRNRLTSWMLHKRVQKPDRPKDPTQLVAFGVSKRVTDEDLLRAFPNSKDIDVRQNTGLVIVTYANQTDCRTDFSTCQGGVIRAGKAKLRVQFGHVNHVPASERRSLALEEGKKQQQQQQRLPREKPTVEPKKASYIDPSLFNKCQLVIRNFKPATQDWDLTEFLSGAKKVFFTPNRRLAFVHFNNETAASKALIKLSKEELNGAKLKGMYAMDKPDKKKTKETPASVANGNNVPSYNVIKEEMQVDETTVEQPVLAKAKKFQIKDPQNQQKQQQKLKMKKAFKKSTSPTSGAHD